MHTISSLAVVMAHFEPNGWCRHDTHHFIRACHQAGVHTRVISTGMNEFTLNALAPWSHVERRANVGYDFFSYRQGIFGLLGFSSDEIPFVTHSEWQRRLQQSSLERLALVNSSILISNPHKLLAVLSNPLSGDAHGMTFSRQRAPHLQSYCISFTRAAMESAPFFTWWKEMPPINDREQVIRTHELGLTRMLHGAGLRTTHEYHPTLLDRLKACKDLPEKSGMLDLKPIIKGQKVNPTMHLWKPLWLQYGVAKIELIHKNPYQFDLSLIRESPHFQLLAPLTDRH